MANILRPDLIWIEGRCYRAHADPTVETGLRYEEHDPYENEIIYNNEENEGDDDHFVIDMIDSSRYSTSFHVAKPYLGSIIGRKGATKSRIEHDTRTEIKIPRQGQSGDIVIFGPSASNVKASRRRINIIVMSSRMKQRPTHFISIPLNNEGVMKNFDNFKETVLRECPSRGLDESLFIKSSKLHLTMGVMCLMDNTERMLASELLTEAKDKIIMPMLQGHMPLKVRVKGLSYMNDDPEHINVLYGCVQEEGAPSDLLQTLADTLVDHFCKAGLMQREYGRENVKLHVTLINAKYRKHPSNTSKEELDPPTREYGRPSRKALESFDGSVILQKFADYDFGVVEVTEVHLSQRHAMGANGYYQPTYVVTCK